MTYLVERNIPIPPKNTGGLMPVLKSLCIGESVLVAQENAKNISGTVSQIYDKTYCRRVVGGGTRVWRTA